MLFLFFKPKLKLLKILVAKNFKILSVVELKFLAHFLILFLLRNVPIL